MLYAQTHLKKQSVSHNMAALSQSLLQPLLMSITNLNIGKMEETDDFLIMSCVFLLCTQSCVFLRFVTAWF